MAVTTVAQWVVTLVEKMAEPMVDRWEFRKVAWKADRTAES
jgi:hypothetical protein